MLSDSDTDGNDLHTITINEHFAKAFECKKEREELAKLKEKYGSDYLGPDASIADDSEDSEDTEEDSDGEELTPAVDAAILRTLALIRKKDPAIYEGSRQVFEEEHTQTQDRAPSARLKKKDSSKRLTIREAALVSALADDDHPSRSASPEPRPLTHTEEQVLLRSETRAAFRDAIDPEGQGDDDLLIPRSRTRDEVELEEEEYKTFLENEVGEDLRSFVNVDANEAAGVEGVETVGGGDKKQEGKKKKDKKEREKERQMDQEKVEIRGKKAQKKGDKNSKEETDQEFLLNYIFNRGWIDRSSQRVPTYNEIVASSSKPSKGKSAESQVEPNNGNVVSQNSIDESDDNPHDGALSDENSFDDLADAFETSYNFRFEEPGGALITSFPRNVSVARRESTTRKDARTRKKQRQESEKQTLLEVRREEIRKERALVEAIVAEEGATNGDTLMIENDTSKKSKKQQRKEELARMKTLKAKELRRKLEMVSSEGGLAGISDEALTRLDLDADWDPTKHDAQMSELYGGDVDGEDTEKPAWDDDINIDDIDPSTSTKSKAELKKQKRKAKRKNEDEDIGVDVDEMDADLDTGTGWDSWTADDEEWRGTEAERKRKVDAYMDEVVNKLGFSGITSHMPTRFHYTSTAPETYNLTPAEILLATDTELNSYVGLKKLAPYRVDKDGKTKKSWDPKRAQRLKDFRESLHSRVGSKYEGSWTFRDGINSKALNSEAQSEKQKRKGKKERAKLKAAQIEDGEEESGGDNVTAPPEVVRKSQKRERDSDVEPQVLAAHSGEAEIEGEPSGQKKKRRRHHKKGSGGGGGVDVSATS